MATGKTKLSNNYATTGLASTFSVKDQAPESEPPFCYTYAPSSTCTDEQLESVIDGTAIIQDYIVIDNNTSKLFPQIAAQANGSQGAGNSTGSGGGSGGGSGNGGGSSGSGADNAAPGRATLSALLLLTAILFAFCKM